MQAIANATLQKRLAIFSAENDVDQIEAQRLRHAGDYKSRLQRFPSAQTYSWGFAPGWHYPRLRRLSALCFRICGFAQGSYHSVAPLALALAASLISLSPLMLGCKSAPSTTPPPKPVDASYPPRPSTPPPPVKLFHQTDNSLTLVTASAATDDQISAILYQLHDAARAHTFDTLHLPQKFIDARKPIVWFHIYRGPQCAAEKYATKLPCGASYHAAGDYTLGSYTDPNWDNATLLHHDPESEIQLWNPEARR